MSDHPDSQVGHVKPAARTDPPAPPARRCPACGNTPPAGMVRCPQLECRGDYR